VRAIVAATGEPKEAARYRFGPLERRGLIAGWRGGQVAVVVISLVAALACLRGATGGPGLAGALLAVVVGLAVACLPLRGRTLEEWVPVVVGWLLGWPHHRHRSAIPTLGGVVRAGAPGDRGLAHLVPGSPAPAVRGRAGLPGLHGLDALAPPPLRGCRVLAPLTGSEGLRMGVVEDSRARTYTAVVSVAGPSFALLGAEEQESLVSAWSGVLAGLAREGSPVRRLQWVARSRPGGMGVFPPAPQQGASAAAHSYAEVTLRAARRAQHHEVLLALSLPMDRAGRTARGGGQAGALSLLGQEVQAMMHQLGQAGVIVLGVLGPVALARTLRQPLEASPGLTEGHGQVPWPWPMASEVMWMAYRTEATWHATYWVAEWPRLEVGQGFLMPLLLHSGVHHAMSLTMEPITPRRSIREVRQARVADVADTELRRRAGFLTTARRHREVEVVARREMELADGHAEYRFSGYATVTASSPEQLERDRGRLEQAATRAHLELVCLYGQQDVAFTWTLPLGRGLQ
jgi:hypothetical protein